MGFPVKWWQSPVTLPDTKTRKTTIGITIKWWIIHFHRRIFSEIFSHNSLPGTFLLLEGSIICSHYTRNEYLWSRDKVGTKLQDERSEVRILTELKDFFFVQNFQNCFGTHPNRSLFLEIKRPECEANHLPPSCTEVLNYYSYNSAFCITSWSVQYHLYCGISVKLRAILIILFIECSRGSNKTLKSWNVYQ